MSVPAVAGRFGRFEFHRLEETAAKNRGTNILPTVPERYSNRLVLLTVHYNACYSYSKSEVTATFPTGASATAAV